MQNNQTNFGPQWNGSPQFATKNNLLSTTAGTFTFITATSNVLQTEINSIVAGGTTSLWANYPALRYVDLSGNNLSNADKITARFLSTMDLQVSSINGSEIKLTPGNVIIENVSINNGTVSSSNSSSSNTTLNRTVGAINAVAATVQNINQAVGGVLSNSFGALQQAYWGVATAGQVVDLANGTVQLATGIQAMIDSRQNNLVSGPAGPPGQTTNVYETFNHTTQFQFSTLGSPTFTVFRTTDQVNPNQTFGREIFISTILPAGSKVVRSVSDPMNMPIISTQLLSTTNYIQSFGQWSAVLGNDYNLTASTLKADYINASSISTINFSTANASISTINGWSVSNPIFNSVSTNQLSTGTAFISSINGQPISAFINTGDVVFNSVSTNQLSTGLAFISSINGQPISAFINTGDVVFNSVSTNQLSTGASFISSINGVNSAYFLNPTTLTSLSTVSISSAVINVSSISTSFINGYNGFFNNLTISSLNASTLYIQNIIDNFVSTTTGEFDIINTSTLVAAQIFTNTIQTNNITGIERLSLSNIVGNSYSVVYPTKNLSSYISSISLQQSGFFNFETNAAPSPPSGIVYINSIYGVWVYPSLGSAIGTTNLLEQNVYIQPGYAGTPSSGSITFFAVGSAGFLVYFIQQGDGLNQAATPFIVEPGWYVRIDYVFTPGYYQNATYSVVYLYTPIPGSATSTLTTSKTNLITDVYETVLDTSNIYQNSGITTKGLGNLALNVSTIAFGSNTTRNNTVPYQFNGAVSMPSAIVPQITASSITGCLYNSLVSTIPTKAGIPGANQTLLNAYVGIYSPIPVLNLTQLFEFNDTNYSYWNNNAFAGTSQFTTWYCALIALSVNPTAQVDFYIGDAVNIQISYPGTPTRQQITIGNVASGLPQKVRFTFASGSWSYTYSFSSSTSLDNYNSLVINQNASQTSINTTDALVLSTSLFQIYGTTFLDTLVGQYANISTLSSVNVNTGQINAANTTTAALSTTSISTNSIVANSITANSLNTTSITTTSPLTIPSLSTINISTSIATAANLIALTRLTTPSISTLRVLNGFNARAIQNPGNIIIYQQTVSFGSGTGTLDINTSPWVPGVYTASAVCRGNPFRTLEATFYYTNSSFQFCQNSQGFDNYNGVRWDAYPGYLRFVSQTDGGGDTFDIYMYMISGQYTAIGDDPPFPFPSSVYATTASVNTGTPTPIIIGLSTMIGSTITMQATENFSILANISPPAYFSTGSITIAGTNEVDVLGNIVAIGGQTDVDIQANTNNVNIVAASTISCVAPTVNINGLTTLQISGTSAIPAVSPLAITNGNDYAGTSRSQIEFQFYGGGFNHYISSRHNANVLYDSGNAIDFWLYNYSGGGVAQTASSSPGVGNVNTMSITASNVVINRPLNMNNNNIVNTSNLSFATTGAGTLTVDSNSQLTYNKSGSSNAPIALVQFGTGLCRINTSLGSGIYGGSFTVNLGSGTPPTIAFGNPYSLGTSNAYSVQATATYGGAGSNTYITTQIAYNSLSNFTVYARTTTSIASPTYFNWTAVGFYP